MKILVTSCVLGLLLFSPAFAKEITILFTGDTHAMIYPCNCPIEPDGGIARRAALVKELRKENPDTLLLDSGGFFGGGLADEYTQNVQLDMQRTAVNVKAMELMQYNAAAIGDDSFNFGIGFLQDVILKTKVNFLSCNIEPDPARPLGLLPYIIKEVAGTRFGIIGVTNIVSTQKSGGLKINDPVEAVKRSVEELKKKKVSIIVLLSHLGETADLSLINDVAGIDILLVAHSRNKDEPFTKVGSTLIIRPNWQGKKLGKLTFTVTDNKIGNYKVEKLRLSDKIADDPQMLSILPRCFSDNNCKKEQAVGICKNPGSLNSRCEFSQAARITLTIIVPRDCATCVTDDITGYLKKYFPGLVISYLYYPDGRANKLIRDFDIKGLPVYLLGKEIEQDKGFTEARVNLEKRGDYYMLKPTISGVSYYLHREKIKGRLDIFLSLYTKDAKDLLAMLKEYNPGVHFLAVEQGDNFDAARGNLEAEEYLRSVCVQKYYPQIFWDYISCRAGNIDSSWWEDCLGKLDTAKIKACARCEEGKELLRENIGLNKELQVMYGPTYLLNNQETFTLSRIPTKELLKKIIKKR